MGLDEVPGTSTRQVTHRLPLKDISKWTERYAVMAALLCLRFPKKGPELFAYLQTIVAAERNYEANQWVTYDRMYRRLNLH